MNGDEGSYPELLAVAAVSVCHTWAEPAKRREQVLAYWRTFGSLPGVLTAAADAVPDLPKLIPDNGKDVERKKAIREMLDMKSPEQELNEMREAQVLLQALAREFG